VCKAKRLPAYEHGQVSNGTIRITSFIISVDASATMPCHGPSSGCSLWISFKNNASVGLRQVVPRGVEQLRVSCPPLNCDTVSTSRDCVCVCVCVWLI
jgi:hypothetical protein